MLCFRRKQRGERRHNDDLADTAAATATVTQNHLPHHPAVAAAAADADDDNSIARPPTHQRILLRRRRRRHGSWLVSAALGVDRRRPFIRRKCRPTDRASERSSCAWRSADEIAVTKRGQLVATNNNDDASLTPPHPSHRVSK